MKISEFMLLPEYEDFTQITEGKLGMKFLHGSYMRAQKDSKEIGSVVSFFEIVSVSPNNPKNFSYTERMEKLTRPTEE